MDIHAFLFQVPAKPVEQAQLPPLNTNEVYPAQGQVRLHQQNI